MQITTTSCKRFKHKEFLLEADGVAARDLQAVADTIEMLTESGSVFQSEHTFQIGWMTTLVKEANPSYLTLYEPDHVEFPIRWVPGITRTLRSMMLQRFVADSVDMRSQMDFPSIMQSALVCSRYASTRDIFMQRFEKRRETDSGWFVGCWEDHDHNSPDELELVSLYRILVDRPEIQSFAALPTDTVVWLTRDEGVRIDFEGKQLAFAGGSFLSSWMKEKNWSALK